jgi:hypothetical protein
MSVAVIPTLYVLPDTLDINFAGNVFVAARF